MLGRHDERAQNACAEKRVGLPHSLEGNLKSLYECGERLERIKNILGVPAAQTQQMNEPRPPGQGVLGTAADTSLVISRIQGEIREIELALGLQ
jgi:hypothetical protein